MDPQQRGLLEHTYLALENGQSRNVMVMHRSPLETGVARELQKENLWFTDA